MNQIDSKWLKYMDLIDSKYKVVKYRESGTNLTDKSSGPLWNIHNHMDLFECHTKFGTNLVVCSLFLIFKNSCIFLTQNCTAIFYFNLDFDD